VPSPQILVIDDKSRHGDSLTTALENMVLAMHTPIAATGAKSTRWCRPVVMLHHKYDDALSFLDRLPQFPDAAPDLVVLGLNQPDFDGLEVLRFMKADPKLRSLPVIALADSASPDDVRKAYDLQANCYLLKEEILRGDSRAMVDVCRFWLETALLPVRASFDRQFQA
jgi:CheY-like chemotaxis protein